jgi:LEA14-like dessication related protein
MKKTLIVVGTLILLTGAGLYLKSQYDLSTKLSYKPENFRLGLATLDKAVINFDFTLENKGDFEIKIAQVDIDVYANDVYATRIYSQVPLDVKPHSTAVLPLQIILNPKSIIKNINQLAFGASSLNAMRLRFKGKIKVKKLGVNIPIPFTYSSTYGELMGA